MRRVPRLPAVLLCVLACSWTMLLVSAPWLASLGGVGLHLSAASYVAGGVICHQRTERSFHHSAGAQWPVCARCTGLYLGGALGLLLGLVLPALGVREPAAAVAGRWTWRTVLFLAALPMVATVGMEWAGLWGVSNAWRAAASLPAAWAVGALAAESSSFQVTL
jgi:uncharacterized membrane protein